MASKHLLDESIYPLSRSCHVGFHETGGGSPAPVMDDCFRLPYAAPDKPSLLACAAYHRLGACVMNMTPALFYVYDLATQRHIWNNAAYQQLIDTIMAASPTLPEATDLRTFVHADDQQELAQAMDKVARLADGDHLEVEYRLCAADGTTWWFWDRMIIFRRDGSGAARQIVGSMFDITARKSLESQARQAQTLESISTLVGGIAHDFNNILTPILGYAELAMGQTASPPKLHRSLTLIAEAAQRAKGVVRQLMTFSRQIESEEQAVALDLLIMETLALLRHTIPSAIQLQTELHTTAGVVFANPVQLQQVITNLCTNAYQAIGERPGRITITLDQVQLEQEPLALRQVAQPGTYVQLTVQDTGCGMDQATLSRIFDPFFTTKAVGKGTGLGLAVVYGIVQALHGGIDVQSEVGRGSTFILYLPAYEQPSPPALTRQVNLLLHSHERILLVDDEQAVTDILREQLTCYGYQVTTCNNGADALALFVQTPPAFDLLIVDQIMPGLTGEQVAAAVLKLCPTMPVIMLSGYSERLSPNAAKAVGISRFIHKPVDAATLCQTVQQVLAPTR